MDDDEDIYAARIGRNMVRVARRRAAEWAKGGPMLQTAMIDSKDPSPAALRDQVQRPDAGPHTLAEFLRVLAAELASDEPDPDAK